MRVKERIPIILDALKIKANRRKLLLYWFKPPPGTQMAIGMPYYDISEIEKMWDNHLKFEEIKEFWLQNPDLRLVQVLINLSYLQNYIGYYYYIEDEIAMIESRILEAENILFWGQNYNEKGDRLSKTNWILIKDMSLGHIQAVLNDYENNLYDVSDIYLKTFYNKLNK